MPNPTDVLLAYAKKQATADDVMRALVEHDDWYLPVHALLEPKVDGRVVIYAQEFSVRTDALLVFSSREAMDIAAEKLGHKAMGVYAGGVKGVDLFGTLNRAALSPAKELIVDGASGQERMWFIKRDGFGLCGAWSSAVQVERRLANLDESLWAELKRYDGWWVPVAKSDQTLVQLPMDGGPHALAFTAPDRYQAFLNQLGPRASEVQSLVVPGARLFQFLLSTQLGGVLLNGRIPFNRDAMDLVATA